MGYSLEADRPSRPPPWATWAQVDVAALRREHAHARLAEPRWAAAVIAQLKDDEVLMRRRGSQVPRGGKGDAKPGPPPKD